MLVDALGLDSFRPSPRFALAMVGFLARPTEHTRDGRGLGIDRADPSAHADLGRHDLQTGLRVAEAASARHGWPLHVIEDCGVDPDVEQPDAFLNALRAELDGGSPVHRRKRS